MRGWGGQGLGSYKHPEVQLFPQSLSELCVTSFSLEMQPVFLTRLPTHVMNLEKSAAPPAKKATFLGVFI